MRTLLLASLLALIIPTTSQALGLGLRLGYGKPGGDLGKNEPMSDYVSSSVPLQLDLMFATSDKTAAGLYLGYANNTVGGDLKSLCDASGASCTSNTVRLGIQFTGQLLDLGLVGLWGGVGTGFEALNVKISGGGDKVEAQYRGWEWATLSAGADLKLIPLINLGLYASYGFGQFNVASAKATIGGVSSDQAGSLDPNKATHNMFQIGLRGLFNL
jgi:hypothetical protein